MKDCALFLAGRYYLKDLAFYKKIARGRFKVAVDGGFSFFRRTRMVPDLLIGDLDSLAGRPGSLTARTKVVTFPKDKDQTDTELALAYCLERGAKNIDMVQPSIGDPDHFLANLFLLADPPYSKKKLKARLRLLGSKFEAYYLRDSTEAFNDAKGSTLSVIPISPTIRLTCKGTAYDVDRLLLKRGRARSARNRIVASKATIKVSGQAFLIRLFDHR